MTLIFLLNMSASWMSPSSITSGLTTTREVSGVTNWYLANTITSEYWEHRSIRGPYLLEREQEGALQVIADDWFCRGSVIILKIWKTNEHTKKITISSVKLPFRPQFWPQINFQISLLAPGSKIDPYGQFLSEDVIKQQIASTIIISQVTLWSIESPKNAFCHCQCHNA